MRHSVHDADGLSLLSLVLCFSRSFSFRLVRSSCSLRRLCSFLFVWAAYVLRLCFFSRLCYDAVKLLESNWTDVNDTHYDFYAWEMVNAKRMDIWKSWKMHRISVFALCTHTHTIFKKLNENRADREYKSEPNTYTHWQKDRTNENDFVWCEEVKRKVSETLIVH